MKVIAKSPCRVDLAGGTMDIWPLYLYHPGAVTVNFAVSRYTTCELETRDDGKIVLESTDQNICETFDSMEALKGAKRYLHPLAAWVVRFFAPPMGLNVRTHSEAPAGAGISGSSALIISTSSALNRLLRRGYSIERVREVSQNIEAQIINVPTGCQDYYPAMYGGVSAIELRVDGIHRKQIPVDLADFNERFVLAYTGKPRNSGINNWEVQKLHINGDRKVFRNFQRIAGISQGMRAALEKAEWSEAGKLLREEWAHRRRNSPGITTELIDRLVAASRKAGAIGAKVCGAGGGGCVIFLVEKGAAPRVKDVILREGGSEGVEILPVTVAPKGVQIKVKA